MSKRVLDLTGRLALRPREAAEALGISERAFRDWLPRLPHIRHGNIVLVPLASLRKWLEEEAQSREGETDAVVREILGIDK